MSDLVHHFFNVKGGVTTAKTDTKKPVGRTVHIAVQGCSHGELDKIYATCAAHEAETGKKIDFLVCCGDFQAIRDASDLRSMAVPAKYCTLGEFAAYHQRKKQAPYLTLFVGGNHEGSDWLASECYGGFLAPNIYYIGHSGAVIVDECVTITGISGIYKAFDYARAYPRRPFYISEAAKRSAYHVRRIEVEKLKAFTLALERMRWEERLSKEKQANEAKDSVTGPDVLSSRCTMSFPRVDLFLSHDWPNGITKYGDEARLLRYKPYFEDDIRHRALGNPHTMTLLCTTRPRYWLAAHLHCEFEATVPHHNENKSPDSPRETKFIALDKCAKGKGFLDFIDIPVESRDPVVGSNGARSSTGEGRVVHHPLWLEVLRETHTRFMENDGSWSAESCSLLHCPPGQLRHIGMWLPASTTMELLGRLGLQPVPLQCPSTGGVHVKRMHDDASISMVVGVDKAMKTTEVVTGGEGVGAVLDEEIWTEDITGCS